MGNHIYIVSDLHLGAPDHERSLKREKHFVRFLDHIKEDASALYLLGDVFDFWFEYKKAVPKGYIRFMGKLAELADYGIDIHIFAGNHDLWYKDYFPSQMRASVHFKPIFRTFFEKKYYLAHGDGLGPGDRGYKLMKKVFTHPLSKWLFGILHPNAGIGLAMGLSRHGGDHDYETPEKTAHRYRQNEPLLLHSKEILGKNPTTAFFVYGHRHVLVRDTIENEAAMFILGDWIQYFSFLKITPEGPELNQFPMESKEPIPFIT